MERIWKALESPQPNLVINSSVRSKIHTRRRKRPVSDLGARFSLKIFPFSSSPSTQTSIYFNCEFGPWCNRIACALVHSPTSQIIPISQAPKIVPPIDGNPQLINTHERSFFSLDSVFFQRKKTLRCVPLGRLAERTRSHLHTHSERNEYYWVLIDCTAHMQPVCDCTLVGARSRLVSGVAFTFSRRSARCGH
jgi:hypothetical protein